MLSRLTAALKGSGWDEEAALELVEDSEPEAGDLAEGGVFEQGGTSAAAFADSFLRRAETESWRLPVPGRLSEGPYDFLELYSGCSRMSGAWAKQGFCVLPPIEFKRGWDMCEQTLFWGLLGLCRSGKVRFLWWAPPCTTFSLARSPKLRSLRAAWGFNLLDEATMLGNLHAVQSLLLALIQLEQGMAFCGEQAAFGFMRGLEPWIALLARGAFEIFFDWCRYGRPFKKTTRLLCNFKALAALGKRCHHHRKHKKLEGSATTLAGAYSDSFCKQVAALCAGAWDTFEAQVSSSFRAGGGVQGDSSGLVEASDKIRVLWAGSSGTGFRGDGRSGALRSGQSSYQKACAGVLSCNTVSKKRPTLTSKRPKRGAL